MRRRGFTLIEVMIVILIIGVLTAIAVPNYVTARSNSQKNTCLANLHAIEGAKEQWAMAEHKGDDDEPTEDDLVDPGIGYIKYFPECPGGGTYGIEIVADRPTCTEPGHVLP